MNREAWEMEGLGCIETQPALVRINRNLTNLSKFGIISDYEMHYNTLTDTTRIFFNFNTLFKKFIGKCIVGVKIGKIQIL